MIKLKTLLLEASVEQIESSFVGDGETFVKSGDVKGSFEKISQKTWKDI